MKIPTRWLCTVLMILLGSSAGAAETVYVSEQFEITLRTGPSTSHKILSLVQSGQALEMVEKGEEWSRVRTPDDKVGWALNRYLTTQTPCSLVLERVGRECDRLNARLEEQKEMLDELRSQKGETGTLLAGLRRERDELSRAYEQLKKESSQFLNLKERHQEVAAAYEAERARSAKLQQENREMKRSRTIHWVMTGGGIMLVGFFIGLFSARSRKPRSSLY